MIPTKWKKINKLSYLNETKQQYDSKHELLQTVTSQRYVNSSRGSYTQPEGYVQETTHLPMEKNKNPTRRTCTSKTMTSKFIHSTTLHLGT